MMEDIYNMTRYLTRCNVHGIADGRDYGCALCHVEHLKMLLRLAHNELVEHNKDYHHVSKEQLLKDIEEVLA